jgi:YHS domain-containing protein
MLGILSKSCCVVVLGVAAATVGCGRTESISTVPSDITAASAADDSELRPLVGLATEAAAPTVQVPPQVAPVVAVTADEEHGHKPGMHGGIIVSIGRDSYHAEAVFEKGGVLRIFMLGNDETRVQEVDAQKLVAYVRPEGGAEASSFALEPEPQEGDAEGQTSQFTGTLPADLAGKALEVTIPSLRIASERFRLGFKSVTEDHAAEMPEKVADDEERQLYLTPGGLYTQADIEANGNATASEKFANFVSAHDLHPKSGDVICPVTLTKANPECTWIIGGKEYQFCCPPCVDEFLQLAKTKPEAVQAPESYVK